MELPEWTPKWVYETIEDIESRNMEEKYFCKVCGFQVIMPMVADVKIERCSCCGKEEISVGLKNHMIEKYIDLDGNVRDFDHHNVPCPFHSEIELICTAYKRGEK